jgi:hypothetical protein
METPDIAEMQSGLATLSAELNLLLRVEEIRLLREKELLLVVYEGRTGSRLLRGKAVGLAVLHTEEFISASIPSFSAAL